jgi:hypothetical protein
VDFDKLIEATLGRATEKKSIAQSTKIQESTFLSVMKNQYNAKLQRTHLTSQTEGTLRLKLGCN